MTNTFLKRRGGGGGDGCWRGEGPFPPDFSTTQDINTLWFSLDYIHACTDGTRTHVARRCHGWCIGCWWYVWCVSRFAERAFLSGGGRLQSHLYCLYTTWPCCGLLVFSSSEVMTVTVTLRAAAVSKSEKWQFNKNENPCSFEAESTQKWWIVILQSSVGEAKMPDDEVKCQIKTGKKNKKQKKTPLQRFNYRGGEV